MAGAFPRRFTLADAMILVAAAGAGLAGARWWYRQPGFVNPSSLDVQSSTELVAWALMPFIPALAMIRLKGPRPRRRKLLRESGFQAITASGLGVVAALLTGRWGIRPGWSSLGYGIGSGAGHGRAGGGDLLAPDRPGRGPEVPTRGDRPFGEGPGLALDRGLGLSLRTLARLLDPDVDRLMPPMGPGVSRSSQPDRPSPSS